MERRLSDIRQQNRELLDESAVYSKLADAVDLQTRIRLRSEIRKKVKEIRLHFETENVRAMAQFTNGARRYMVFRGEYVYLAEPAGEGDE